MDYFITRIEPIRLIDQLYLSTEGIFGIPLAVSASYVMIFVLFGAFMERTGTGQLFMDFAMGMTGHTAGGPGKVSVVSSRLFGTISGSAVANVMVDGPISIPLMKRTGFKPHFAAAVEAVASTGGQIMPPIMGAAAFVMAEFLGVSYAAGGRSGPLIPAILYYVACFAAVHFEAKRGGSIGVAARPSCRALRARSLRGCAGTCSSLCHCVILCSGACYWRCFQARADRRRLLGARFACLLPCARLAAAALTRCGGWAAARSFCSDPCAIDAMIDGASNTLPVALACACAGIIIGVVILTGLGIVFTQWVVGLAQNTLLLALVLTMAAGIVLGMGMPTTPAYIIMVVAAGAGPRQARRRRAGRAHVRVLLRDPVGHHAAGGAGGATRPPGLAKSDLWKTGWAAVKIGAAGFIVPFMFVYEPALLMIGDWPTIVWRFILSCIGIRCWRPGCTAICCGRCRTGSAHLRS